MTNYELWDTESRNVLMEETDNPTEIMQLVRDCVQRCGRDAIRFWSLLAQDDADSLRFISGGTELADLAGAPK